MDKESEEFAYLTRKFPKRNEAKTKEGISFVHKLHNYSKNNT